MDRAIAIVFIFAATLLGWWKARRIAATVRERADFAHSFRELLLEYLSSGGRDHIAYARLIERSPRMQRELGSAGTMSYRPAATNYIVHNYQIVLNMLPEYHREMHDDFLSTTQSPRYYAQSLQEALLRHRGELAELEDRVAVGRNPLAWFVTGVREILSAPVGLLRQFGVMSESSIERLSSSTVWRVLSGSVGLIAFISSIVTIVTGWTVFELIVRNYLLRP